MTPELESRLAGAGLCTLSAAGFATLSILGKLAYAEGLSMTGFLSLRFGGAAILLGIFLILRKGRSIFPGWNLVIPLFLLGAIGYFTQSSLYFLGLQRIPASLSSVLLYFYPVFVALLAWGVTHRPPRKVEWGAMALAFAGVVLTVTSGGSSESRLRPDPLGVILVIGSAAAYSIYILVSNRFAHRAGSLISTAWITLGASLSFGLAGLATHSWVVPFSARSTLLLISLILFSTILPLATFLAGMARVGPTAASLLSMLEPVFTVLLAMLVLGERLTPLQLTGGSLVLAAVVLLSLPARRATTAEAG